MAWPWQHLQPSLESDSYHRRWKRRDDLRKQFEKECPILPSIVRILNQSETEFEKAELIEFGIELKMDIMYRVLVNLALNPKFWAVEGMRREDELNADGMRSFVDLGVKTDQYRRCEQWLMAAVDAELTEHYGTMEAILNSIMNPEFSGAPIKDNWEKMATLASSYRGVRTARFILSRLN